MALETLGLIRDIVVRIRPYRSIITTVPARAKRFRAILAKDLEEFS